jgi:hypothetical protein
MGGHKGDVTVVKDWNLIVQLKVQRLARADAIWRKVKSRGIVFFRNLSQIFEITLKTDTKFFLFSQEISPAL